MNDSELREIVECAQDGDCAAVHKILEKFKPILLKNSFVNGKFDDDCFQELNIKLIKCITNFKFNDIHDIYIYFAA